MTVARPHIRVWPSIDLPDRFIDLAPNDIQAFTCSADCISPGGTFTLRLNPGRGVMGGSMITDTSHLLRVIQPNAVVSIGYDEPGGIMLGLVSAVNQVMAIGTPAQTSLEVSGRGLAAKLLEDQVVSSRILGERAITFREQLGDLLGFDHPALAWFPTDLGPQDPNSQVNAFAGASLRDVVDWIRNRAPSMQIPLLQRVFGGRGFIGEYLNTEGSVTTWNEARIYTDELQTYSGSVWGWLQSAVDVDFYEVFVDTKPTSGPLPTASLILRPKPFDDDTLSVLPTRTDTGITAPGLRTRWNDRQHHVLSTPLVQAHTLGWDDAEAFSLYMVTSEIELGATLADMAQGLAYPVVDLYALLRHGMRPFMSRVTMLGADIAKRVSGDQDYTAEERLQTVDFRNRLINWYRWAPWFLKGTVTVLGRDEYRPGEPYYMPEVMPRMGSTKGVRFYGTRVTWSWAVGAPYLCTIQLTRGYNASCIDAARKQVRDVAPLNNPSMMLTADTGVPLPDVARYNPRTVV